MKTTRPQSSSILSYAIQRATENQSAIHTSRKKEMKQVFVSPKLKPSFLPKSSEKLARIQTARRLGKLQIENQINHTLGAQFSLNNSQEGKNISQNQKKQHINNQQNRYIMKSNLRQIFTNFSRQIKHEISSSASIFDYFSQKGQKMSNQRIQSANHFQTQTQENKYIIPYKYQQINQRQFKEQILKNII